MLRVTLFALFIGIGAFLFAQGKPTPVEPKAATAPTAQTQPAETLPGNPSKDSDNGCACKPVNYATLCVCAIYPIFFDGTSVLYYSEICTAATACSVNDVAYYWAADISWPRTCDTSAPPNTCPTCDAFAFMKSFTDPAPFPGMKMPIAKGATAQFDLIPPHVTYDNRTRHAYPSRGVKAESGDGFYAYFDLSTTNRVYVKLFIINVEADQQLVNAPVPETRNRLLYVGYQVDHNQLEQSQKDNAIPAQSFDVAYRRTSTGSVQDSDFVRKVRIGPNTFLVLLEDGR